MAQDIDQKLRVTMVLVGAVTLKDLAAAFRRVNPATSFDVDRAYKWMQGRARPRELRLYEDWAKVVDLGRPGAWIADCALDDFIQEICARHDCDRDTLERRSEPSHRSVARQPQDPSLSLAGTRPLLLPCLVALFSRSADPGRTVNHATGWLGGGCCALFGAAADEPAAA